MISLIQKIPDLCITRRLSPITDVWHKIILKRSCSKKEKFFGTFVEAKN
jgi:hypothetical protein